MSLSGRVGISIANKRDAAAVAKMKGLQSGDDALGPGSIHATDGMVLKSNAISGPQNQQT
jgi:hypothetical protein